MLQEIVVKEKELLSDCIGENTDLGYYRIQKVIKNRNVKINGVRVGSDQNVNVGDVVYVFLADREKDSIEVVYRDDNILVVNKNAGIEVVGENSLTERINNILTDVTAAWSWATLNLQMPNLKHGFSRTQKKVWCMSATYKSPVTYPSKRITAL